MTIYLIVEVLLIVTLIVLCGMALWNNDKLVAFEAKFYDRFCDRIGYLAARIYIAYRKRKIDKSIRRIERALKILDREESYLEKVQKKNKAACSYRPKFLQATQTPTTKVVKQILSQ